MYICIRILHISPNLTCCDSSHIFQQTSLLHRTTPRPSSVLKFTWNRQNVLPASTAKDVKYNNDFL